MAFHFIKARPRANPRYTFTRKADVNGGRDALDRLNSFLDEESPQAAEFVQRLHENQQNAITYQELREAILNGHMDIMTLQAWQEDYSRFVMSQLRPLWVHSMGVAASGLQATEDGFTFNISEPRVHDWIERRSATFITNQSDESRRAIQSMINLASSDKYSVGELARIIRPTIGLTERQAQANGRYYTHVRDELLRSNPTMRQSTAVRRAREAAAKYAGKQHRYRADTIAQTELAYAYHKGMDEAIRQAQQQGYMPQMVRRWITARDHGVCPICQDLNGAIIDMDASFDIPFKEAFPSAHETPPAHPRCRCAVEYVELATLAAKVKRYNAP